jgi:hypothetical protein
VRREKAFHHKDTKINTKGHKEDRKTREERRVEKTESRDHEGDKGGRRDGTSFVSFVLCSAELSLLVFSLVFLSSLWPFVLIFVPLW